MNRPPSGCEELQPRVQRWKVVGGVTNGMAEVKIVQRSLKNGEYYKFPLKALKLLEFNKINIHSLYIYLLIQDYLFESDKSIIYLNEIELAYKLHPSRFMESLELLRIHKLLIYKRINENRVAVGFLGFNTDPEVEVEVRVTGLKPSCELDRSRWSDK